MQNMQVDQENFKVSLRSLSAADLESQDSVLPIVTNGYSMFTGPQYKTAIPLEKNGIGAEIWS